MSNTKKKIIRTYKRSADYKKADTDFEANRIIKTAGQHNCKYCPPWEHDNRVGKGSLKKKRNGKKPKYKNKRT